MKRNSTLALLCALGASSAFLLISPPASSDDPARDPGMRSGLTNEGMPITGLTATQIEAFNFGQDNFREEETVAAGLGPTMNLNSCVGCHAHPAVGGSSPPLNPQVAFARLNGANNQVPSFITADGPVREVRFIRNPDGTADGGVHALFTIAGMHDAPGCHLAQPDFATAQANKNLIFRIPTPLFGAGLIEQIPDTVIVANLAANAGHKHSLGIQGRPNFVHAGQTITGQTNNNGNDGTIARFGWKAQNKSLLLFSGEAYNVEMGITNEIFQTERNETPACQFATTPNSIINTDGTTAATILSDIEKFSLFMRFLAPPTPVTDQPGGANSIARGRAIFNTVGCVECHTSSLKTGKSAVAALSNQPVNLFSDLAIHDMGSGLADGISQGEAGPSEFRTAPLWGLGKRTFFLHDGRTADLIVAIRQHQSPGRPGDGGSEANTVVDNFNHLPEAQKKDMLNFLRSL